MEKKKNRRGLLVQIGIFLVIYAVVLFFFWTKLPDVTQLASTAEEVYRTYGYLLIFLGALVEGTFIIGFYIPGSFIVFLGVSLARMGITSFPLVIFFGVLGFCLGYSINYCLGRFWYNVIKGVGYEKQIMATKEKLRHHYTKALFWGYVMPSTGSMLSLASGIIKVPFKEFLLKTFLIQFFWSLVLGGLAYVFGMTFIHVFLVYFGTIAVVSFVLYVLHSSRKKGRKEHGNHSER